MTTVAPMCGVPVPNLFADGQLSGSSIIIAPSPSFTHHSFVVISDEDVSAGAVQVLTTQNYEDAVSGFGAAVGGGPLDVSTPGQYLIELTGVYTFLILLFSTDVVDGNVTASYLGAH